MITEIPQSSPSKSSTLFSASVSAFAKLNPFNMMHNPVMFLVELGSIITTIVALYNASTDKPYTFDMQLALWMWFTVLFSNFAEALAEGKSKAQTQSLKQSKKDVLAHKFLSDGSIVSIHATELRKGDKVSIAEGEIIPCDGEVIEGIALIDESPITGESAPILREEGGDKTSVTGGTKIISGKIKVLITANPGDTFIDHMIKMIEGAQRQKTPNEKALEILLIALALMFLTVVITLRFYAAYVGINVSIPVLVAILVCLVPTTIGGLLPAIGIAGMNRLFKHNVIALSGRAVEAAGDVNIVLLDKTGTITIGNRLATELIPASNVSEQELAHAALLSSFADTTPEGKSIVTLAKEKLAPDSIKLPTESVTIPFSAETRMSGIDTPQFHIRKGASDAIQEFVATYGATFPEQITQAVEDVAKRGGTPLVVCRDGTVLGVIRLKDVLKQGIKERLTKLHNMGIISVMVTGDNYYTAATIAAEAGVTRFIAQAKPETKLSYIKEFQNEGYMVAMIGDGTNDAPALAQADVAVAMNAGTQAAREAANMVDLDSSPTKLLDIVEIGKQILITRGALTTFSIANDIAKYFALIPALFAVQYPPLNVLNVMHLATSQSATLSAVIFNALIITALIPLALRGITCEKTSVQSLLFKNLLMYGGGGLFLPFVSIKLIDIIIVSLHVV